MSLPPRRARRVDANQREVVDALRAYGAACWILGEPADLLVGFRGRFLTLEVKDGAKPPSARQLTLEEQVFAATCRAMNLPHHIVASVDEAIAALTGAA
jgi:hypothetical protein